MAKIGTNGHVEIESFDSLKTLFETFKEQAFLIEYPMKVKFEMVTPKDVEKHIARDSIEEWAKKKSSLSLLFIKHMEGDLDYNCGDVSDFIQDYWNNIKGIMEGK